MRGRAGDRGGGGVFMPSASIIHFAPGQSDIPGVHQPTLRFAATVANARSRRLPCVEMPSWVAMVD